MTGLGHFDSFSFQRKPSSLWSEGFFYFTTLICYQEIFPVGLAYLKTVIFRTSACPPA